MMNVIVCAPILVARTALCGAWYLPRYLAGRRHRRERADWARLRAGLPELDADLDRTWTAERERIRRPS